MPAPEHPLLRAQAHEIAFEETFATLIARATSFDELLRELETAGFEVRPGR
jgi:hypothetical protein